MFRQFTITVKKKNYAEELQLVTGILSFKSAFYLILKLNKFNIQGLVKHCSSDFFDHLWRRFIIQNRDI